MDEIVISPTIVAEIVVEAPADGVAERMNRTILNKTRALLTDAGLAISEGIIIWIQMTITVPGQF